MKTKIEILENLIREGYIGLDEALVLMEAEKEFVYVSRPYITPYEPPPTINPIWRIPTQPYCGGSSEATFQVKN